MILTPEVSLANPLEDFADDYVREVFTPLYKNDLFLLDLLKSNECAWYAFLCELTEKWTIPVEEQQIIECQLEKYVPKKEL